MKISLFFVLILSINSYVYSQLDASIGGAFRNFKSIKNDGQNFFVLKLDVIKNRWVWNNELSFCNMKRFESTSSSSYSTGGGSSATFYSTTTFNSFIRYTPIVLKEGIDFSFNGQSLLFKNGTASLRFGAFIQADIALEAKEYNKYLISVEGNNNNINHQFVETKRDTTRDFSSAKARIPYLALGLKCSRHIYFDQLFVSWQIGIGGYIGSRFISKFDENSTFYENHNLVNHDRIQISPFLEGSFGIGYRFNGNKKKIAS